MFRKYLELVLVGFAVFVSSKIPCMIAAAVSPVARIARFAIF